MNASPILRHQNLTVLQRIDEFKKWHKQQQLKLNSSNSSQENVDIIHENNVKQTLPESDKSSANIVVTSYNNYNKKPPSDNFDDTPVKGVQPNLHALIENNFPLSGNQQTNHNIEKPKFRFLKKGEGIARFRMGPVKVKKSKFSNKLNLQPERGDKPSDKFLEGNNEQAQKRVELENIPFLQPPDLKLDFKNWKSIFNNGNAIDIIENAIDNNQLDIFQPNSTIDSSTASIMEKLLVVGRKHLKEKEEMRVFEAIEKHLMDSSFSSTSSYVTKLMENAVMSTPEKKPNYGHEKSNDFKSKQFHPSVLNDKPLKSVQMKEIDENSKIVKEPVWTNTHNNEKTINILRSDSESDKDQSLHVRFNEEVDYKSFVESSHSLSGSRENGRKNIEEFDDSNEWKDDSSESSSLCCSQCSSNTVNLVANGRLEIKPSDAHPEHPQTNENSPVEKLDVKDLATDNCQGLATKVSSADEVNMFSPILNAKLKELEDEIEAFRIENNKLKSVRENLEKERKLFQLEKKKFFNEIEEERKKNATYLEDEKQKLAKEKFIFEKYTKNLAKKPLKEERKEIQALREQLNEMKEELNKKESRWGAAQARVRNQVKHLEEDNKKLREEIEVLRRQSKSLQILTQKKSKTAVNNTKLIHAINEHISSIGPVSDDNSKESGYLNTNINGIKSVIVEDVDPKDFKRVQVIKEKLPETSVRNETQNNDNQPQSKNNVTYEETVNIDLNLSSQPLSNDQQVSKFNSIVNGNKLEQAEISSKTPVENTSVTEIINEDGHVEKTYPDGRKEIRLKNGNIKKIDPISGCVKTIYFNGDVKELTNNGTVKYYFAESRIWHTTFSDGLEVLDFPNGQVEKRHTNGVVEIIYPSDCKKITYPDGAEEIFYADGTNIKIDGSKKKVLSLPNGQKEIHTDEFIRREYPDGTVKIVYPDGTTETVYSNGRVRLKDKHGNLVMDSGTTAPIKY